MRSLVSRLFGNRAKPYYQQPPDLDDMIKQWMTKLKGIMKRGTATNKNNSPSNQSGGFGLILGGFGVILGVMWVLSGIFIVDPAEQAVVLRFGQYHGSLSAGPHWIPRFIDTAYVYNVTRVQDYSYSANMLTKDENLVSVSLVVQYRIDDLESYLFNVNNPEESLKQATSSALRQVVGMSSLDNIITEGREAWGGQVEIQLNKLLSTYKTGIKIVNISPQPARAPEAVQDAFDDAIKAQEDEKRYKEQANAYEASVVPIAEGRAKKIQQEAEAYAKQVVLKATGDVAQFNALLPEYQVSKDVIRYRLYFDTISQVLSQSNTMVVSSNIRPFIGLPMLNSPKPPLKFDATPSMSLPNTSINPSNTVGGE
jgi:membrane protease subunit HflK